MPITKADRPIKKILFATTGLRVGGGIASVSRTIARALQEEIKAGRIERVDLLSLTDAPDLEPFFNGEQRTAGGGYAKFIWHAWRLMRHKPDLVLVDHLGLGRAFRLPIPGLKPARRAVFVHGTEFRTLEGASRAAVVGEADLVLTNSFFTADCVREAMPEVANRIRPVPLCIDPELVDTWQPLNEENPPPREPAVLIVARMNAGDPGKGHDHLIRAMAQVRKRIANAELWIAGDGTARPGLEALASESGSGGIHFLGRVTDEELSNRYRRASLFAMPSKQEGFGLVYAEAMWHGLPCIGSYADAATEVIREGETGALVPYGDVDALANQMIDLLEDHEGRTRLSDQARAEALARFAYPRFRDDLVAALGLGAAVTD